MEFRIDRDVFGGALGKVQGIVEKRTTQATLSNVLLQSGGSNSLRVAATDLDVTLQGGYPAEIVTEGAACVSARSLHDIIRALPPGPVVIKSTENHYVEIRAGSGEYRIVGIAAETFPALPAVDEAKGFPIPRQTLMELVDGVLFSISTDDTRPNLNGAFMQAIDGNRLRMVSTDGHRLSKLVRSVDASLDSVPAEGVIIPRKGLAELRRALDGASDTIFFGFQGSQVVFKSENEVLCVRLIDGVFPDFNSVIQEQSSITIVLERLAYLDALRRVSIVSTERTKGVRVEVLQDKLLVTTTNPDLGEAKEEVAADVTGLPEDAEEAFDIGYNARYLIEVLSALSTDEIVLETNDRTSPTIVRDRGEEDSFYVVMPMRF
jgi:DNA polymerase-3 subunit beta